MRTVFALLLLIVAGPARADLYIVPSIECIVYASDAVIRGHIASVGENTVVLEVDETLAGVTEGTQVEVWLSSWRFSPGDAGLFAVTPDDRGHPHVMWIGHAPDGPMPVVDMHQHPLVGDEAIIAAIRARAAWQATQTAPRGLPPLYVEPDEHLYTVMFEGGVVSTSGPSSVAVPPDPEFWPLVVSWATSQDWIVRVRGARALRSYPGPEGTRLLGLLLKDPYVSVRTDAAGAVVERVWSVRLHAWETAQAMGLDVEPPVFREVP